MFFASIRNLTGATARQSFNEYLLVMLLFNNNKIYTTGANSAAGTAYPSGAPEITPVFCGVRVTRSLVLCVCFVDRCLSFLAHLAKGNLSFCHHLASIVR